MNQEEQAMWGSHLAPLLACVGASTGPVLELGVGHFSTPALHAICGALDRRLVSVEADHEWAIKFSHLLSKQHGVFCVDYLHFAEQIATQDEGGWGVAFIDHSPGGASRAAAFAALFPISSYVVVHDYHLENEEHIAPFKDRFNWVTWRVFKHQQPPTLVASLNYGLPECLDQL